MKKIISIGKNVYGWLPITFHSNNEKNNVTASGSEVYNPFVEIQYIINNINNSKYSRWEINQESSMMIVEFKPSKKNTKDVSIEIHNPDDNTISYSRTVPKKSLVRNIKKELLNFAKSHKEEEFEQFYFNRYAVKKYTV